MIDSVGIAAHFHRAAVHRPNRSCLRWDGGNLTYREVAREVTSLTRRLADAGLGPGEKIAVLSPNSHLCIIAMLAIQELGGVWLPVNPRDGTTTIGTTLDRFGCDALLLHPDLAHVGRELGHLAPSIRLLHRLDDLSAAVSASPRLTATHPADRDVAAIFTTGGTTGTPKGVAFSHRRLANLVDTYRQVQFEEDQIYLAAAPLTHAGGRICLSVLACGGTVVVLPAFDPEAVLSAVQRYRVTDLTLTSTMLYRLLDSQNLASYDTSSLKRITYGASPTSVARIRQALNHFGPVLVGAYGQTEAPMFISRLAATDHYLDGKIAPHERLRSVGHATTASTLCIFDDRGQPMPASQIGEIGVRGEFTMSGYYRDPVATAERQIGGFQRTGDVGFIDAEGCLTIVGRRPDLIITGGFNVYPAEVEEAILALPGVREAAVFGVPDEDWGEAVTGAVTLADDVPRDPDALRHSLRHVLGGVKTPKVIHVVDELPRNDHGKILKRILVEMFARQ